MKRREEGKGAGDGRRRGVKMGKGSGEGNKG